MITIVNYGMGNLGSIQNMLKRIGVASSISSDPDTITSARKLILPGVGAFDTGMRKISEFELFAPLRKRVLEDRIPCLGVCLGMQLLTERSDEGELPGLGWIPGETLRFQVPRDEPNLKIPHMGWNYPKVLREEPLFTGLASDPETRFYFVHSYYVTCRDSADVVATAHHGIDFACAVSRGNVFGTQFHPEKSHRFGMKVLENFAAIPC